MEPAPLALILEMRWKKSRGPQAQMKSLQLLFQGKLNKEEGIAQRDLMSLGHVYRVTCSGGMGPRMVLTGVWSSRGAKIHELGEVLYPSSVFN